MRNNDFSKENRAEFFTCAGDPVHLLYSPIVRSDGIIELKEVGKENTDDLIESYRESTDLKTILARFANGDVSALNRYQGYYADVSEIPKDHRAALQLVMNAEAAFAALPLSLREKFDNNWHMWLSLAGSDEWFDAMDDVVPGISPSEPIKSTEAESAISP